MKPPKRALGPGNYLAPFITISLFREKDRKNLYHSKNLWKGNSTPSGKGHL